MDAEVVQPGVVRLDTSNVAEVKLSLPPPLRHSDGSLQVIWNGQARGGLGWSRDTLLIEGAGHAAQ